MFIAASTEILLLQQYKREKLRNTCNIFFIFVHPLKFLLICSKSSLF